MPSGPPLPPFSILCFPNERSVADVDESHPHQSLPIDPEGDPPIALDRSTDENADSLGLARVIPLRRGAGLEASFFLVLVRQTSNVRAEHTQSQSSQSMVLLKESQRKG